MLMQAAMEVPQPAEPISTPAPSIPATPIDPDPGTRLIAPTTAASSATHRSTDGGTRRLRSSGREQGF